MCARRRQQAAHGYGSASSVTDGRLAEKKEVAGL
jgi:hypothetical protein